MPSLLKLISFSNEMLNSKDSTVMRIQKSIDDYPYFHHFNIKTLNDQWEMKDKEDYLIYSLTIKNNVYLLFDAEGNKVCKLSSRGLLKGGYTIEATSQCKAFKKVILKQSSSGTGLLSYNFKFTEFSGKISEYKWISYSPKKWLLVKADSQKTFMIYGIFEVKDNNDCYLLFHPNLNPSCITSFTIAMFFISSNHITLLDALGITSLELNLI